MSQNTTLNHTQEKGVQTKIGIITGCIQSQSHIHKTYITYYTHSGTHLHYLLSHTQQTYTERETRCVFTVIQGGRISFRCHHQAWCWHSGCLLRSHWDASLSSTPPPTGPVICVHTGSDVRCRRAEICEQAHTLFRQKCKIRKTVTRIMFNNKHLCEK